MSSLDRKSIAQGMRLVSIAADEYDEGNEALGLEIYLSGIDKVLMALPSNILHFLIATYQFSDC
ncbi:hypothetical protein J3Q64DRAFT_1635461 [Phycomyces blakesleeanus]|uniref:Uncharacterized protein n=1 Tax=Phycomyces blakesleeanus TaxID=4837 RepID=A0ABR3BAN2_PHYBL